MGGKRRFVRGHKTMIDGTRVPMTEAEGEEIWAMVQKAKDQRAKDYPETIDALQAFCDADQRLTDLGWKKYTFGLEDGAELAVIERSSTGIFAATWNKPYFQYSGCVSGVGKVWWKPIADLTDAERARMGKCSADHAAFMENEMKILSRISEMFKPKDDTP